MTIFVETILPQMYKISELRNYEVREMYWTIYTIHKHNGESHREAMGAAYEAVSLRYGITDIRIRKILKLTGKLTPEERTVFRTQYFERMVTLSELLSKVLKNEFGCK